MARLVRFANVDGCAVPDPRASLPGRGAWLHPDRRMLRGCDDPSRLQPRLQGARIPLTGHRRLNPNMAKKRVHELAKQYDMPTSEVIKRLNASGLEVKAAATAVDEKLADAALTGKPKPKAAANGAAEKPAAQPVLQQRAGFGHGTARAPRAENLAPKTPPKPKAKPKPEPGAATAPAERSAPAHAFLAAGRARSGHGRRRPPRRHRLPGRASRSRRRSRRRPGGGPGGGPPEPPAAPSRWPAPSRHLRGARRAGRRVPEGRRHPGQLRLDGQGRRRVPRHRRPGGHQEADEPRRDGDAHADAVRRRDPGHRRRVREGDRDRHGGRGRQRRPDVRRRRRGSRAALAGDHDHGSRRPRQDLAAGRDPLRRTWPRARPAASRSTSAPTRSTRTTAASSRSWTPRATRRSPPCVPAAPRRRTSP